MIDLNNKRLNPLDVMSVSLKDLPDVDLQTVQYGDWLEGFGNLDDYAIVGFLKRVGLLGLQLKKREP